MLTVDYTAATVTAKAAIDSGILPMWANQSLLLVIAILQTLKYFFPKIDGKK